MIRLKGFLFFLLLLSLAVPAFAQLGVVTTRGNSRIQIIDLESNQVIYEIVDQVRGQSPRGVQITPDGTLAIVTTQLNDRSDLMFIDLTAKPPELIDRLSTREFVQIPLETVITSDGKFALVRVGSSKPFYSLLSVDIASRQIVDVVDGFVPNLLSITPDRNLAIGYSAFEREMEGFTTGLRMYVITSEGKLLDTGQRIRIGRSVQTLAITPNGRLLLATADGNVVLVFSIADDGTIKPVQTMRLDQRLLIGIVITPDGSKVYLPDYFASNVRILRIDEDDNVEDTGIRIPVPNGTARGIDLVPGIAMTSDGKRAYLCSSDSNVVSIIDVEHNTVLPQVIPVGLEPGGIALQPW